MSFLYGDVESLRKKGDVVANDDAETLFSSDSSLNNTNSSFLKFVDCEFVMPSNFCSYIEQRNCTAKKRSVLLMNIDILFSSLSDDIIESIEELKYYREHFIQL